MQISKRVQALTTSPIRGLVPYADAAKARGIKVYHLNIGQPDIETPPQFVEALRKYDHKVVAYGNSQGEPVLLQAISNYYKSWNMDYGTDNIFITNGGSEALSFAIGSLCDPEDELLVFEPYYANYNSFSALLNVKVVGIPTNPANGYRLPDLATVEKYITPRTKAILVTNPGNPTGVVFTQEEMAMLTKVVLKHNLGLIADEVYREFVYDGAYESFGTVQELADHLIIIDSVSKRYSACGARIGCIITKQAVLCQQLKKCCATRLCVSGIMQEAAAALYTTPKSYLAAVNQEYKKRRDTIKAELAKIPGLTSSDPQGAFYVMVKLPVDNAKDFALWLLNDFNVNGETVMFAPGYGFYVHGDRDGLNEARIAYVLNCDDIKKAISLLAAGIKAYNSRKQK
jgi:aspartate aminotransferase